MIFLEPMAGANLMTDAEKFTDRHPEYGERFEAIKEHRDLYQAYNESSEGKQSPFRSVASLSLPIDRALWVTNQLIFKDKQQFYKWLDQNQAYCTYDRRKAQAESSRPHTYVDGKAV